MISTEDFESYRRALDTNADLIQAAILDLGRSLVGLSGDELLNVLSSAYYSLVNEYGSYAAAVAVEFYEQQRATSNLKPYEAEQFSPDNHGLLYYDAQQALQLGMEIDSVLTELAGKSQQRVMEYADETLIQNASRDPAKPKWALVPSTGACAWCRMMASNGFMYSSKVSANRARHPHCLCTPVIDFGTDAGVDGYDPDALYDEYKAAYDKAKETAWDEWSALTKEEKDKYKVKGRGAFDHFLRNKTLQIMGK